MTEAEDQRRSRLVHDLSLHAEHQIACVMTRHVSLLMDEEEGGILLAYYIRVLERVIAAGARIFQFTDIIDLADREVRILQMLLQRAEKRAKYVKRKAKEQRA